MARREFLQHIKDVFNNCIQNVQTGSFEMDAQLSRIAALQRSLTWARGQLLSVAATNTLKQLLDELTQELQNLSSDVQQGSSGYQALRTEFGLRGASRYSITREQLEFLISYNFTIAQIASILYVSESTVKRRLRKFHILPSDRYSRLTDSELDDLVKELVGRNWQIGPESVRARLLGQGILVQRQRVRASLLRTDPAAAAQRTLSQRLYRRAYHVAGPNSLWHLDGNHKLIRWRIVIHGGIDGFSRMITMLQASTNNQSATVMKLFMEAVQRYGVPSRVRCDYGGENNFVCAFMEVYRGLERGSALRGRSTHNQRVERLWGDLWRGITNTYYELFSFLEEHNIINVDNEMHLWALHFVYIPRLNRDLQLFAAQWNNHGLRTERRQTPHQIFVRGFLNLQHSPLTAIQDIFGQASPSASTAGPGQAASQAQSLLQWHERVHVPNTQYQLEPNSFQQLVGQCDPLGGDRGSLGIPVLQRVLTFLRQQ